MRRYLLVAAFGVSAACGAAGGPVPFEPVANVDQLMVAIIAPASQTYWESVSSIVDKDGITEHFPRTDDEWAAVWRAGMTIAESGNLLMIPPRARDDEWMTYASNLVDAGLAAAKAAEARDPEQVLEKGEEVYNVCTGCHMQYVVDDVD